MTIHQLKDRCWVLDPNPYGGGEAGILHFPNADEAGAELVILQTERRADDRTRVKRDGAVCWVADCDGCGKRFTDDEAGGSHFGTVEGDLEDYLRWDGWTRTAPDGCRCWACSPEDAALPEPTPAELEAAGQMRLPGVA
jgi:hypothetical protein